MNIETLISVLILSVVFAAFIFSRRDARKAGAANPVGTAELQSDMAKVKDRLTKVEVTVKKIEEEIDGLPSKADIARLEERVAGVAGYVENIDNAVVRIEEFQKQLLLPAPARAR